MSARFTIRDAHTEEIVAGLADIDERNGCLFKLAFVPSLSSLAIGEKAHASHGAAESYVAVRTR